MSYVVHVPATGAIPGSFNKRTRRKFIPLDFSGAVLPVSGRGKDFLPHLDMRQKNFYRRVIVIQSLYLLMTALWPILHISSFMKVTGHKTDVWLVKTVGAIFLPIAVTLFSLRFDQAKTSAGLLGGGIALVVLIVDVKYAVSNTISPIYLIDAFVQSVFLACWCICMTLVKTFKR